jgi:methylated-DNA-[protein]-cysteine S-methyltransferase
MHVITAAESIMSVIYWHQIGSPVGPLVLAGDGTRLKQIHFHTEQPPPLPEPDWVADPRPFAQTIAQLEAYFAGRLLEFDLPLAPEGTPFQLSVWQQLRRIPYGQTVCYGELARRIGNPRAARAVGLANGSNPLPIIVPCHRVIGADGSLTGFGGGLPIKRKLLELERETLAHQLCLIDQ